MAAPVPDRVAFLEALVVLAIARVVVAVGLPLFGKRLVRAASRTAPGAPLNIQREVRRAILLATKNVPWSSICLPNAIAGKVMLARRGYESTLHLGVGRHVTKAGKHNAGDLHAHAWLEAGGTVVLGESGRETVTQITPSHSTL